MIKVLGLVIGGVTGTVSRYLFSRVVHGVFGTDFPYGTLFVNLVGCFIIGFLASIVETRMLLGPNGRVLLIIGFCGAFTTFSMFILETSNLVDSGQTLHAFANLFVAVIVGFVLLRAGIFLGKTI